eukprot:4520697-Prymnesium_polylepis.1
MSVERAVRPPTVSSFVQRSGAARAPDCSQVPRGRWCVDRRLSCGTDMWHDASTGCSICGGSVRRLQQHVGAVALAPLVPCGLLRLYDHGRNATATVVITPHRCSQLSTEGRTQTSERDTRRAVITASRPEQLRTCRGFVRAP